MEEYLASKGPLVTGRTFHKCQLSVLYNEKIRVRSTEER